jgi:hypothetical protein
VADWQGLHQIQTIQTKISIDYISGPGTNPHHITVYALYNAFSSKYFTLAGNSWLIIKFYFWHSNTI